MGVSTSISPINWISIKIVSHMKIEFMLPTFPTAVNSHLAYAAVYNGMQNLSIMGDHEEEH